MTSVLIVDDDATLRGTLSRCLSTQGHHVSDAGSLSEALAALYEAPADVIVTDLRSDGVDGLQLIRQAREVSPSSRAILMSASASARDHQTAMTLGAVKVLCKPFSSRDLISAVQQAIDCEVGYRGSLYGLSLIDVLQIFHYGHRSITISLTGLVSGQIHFENGEIIHATHAELTGEDALQALLTQSSGAICAAPAMEVPTTIIRPFDALLLDLLRLVDEGSTPPVTIDPGFGLEEDLGPTSLFPAGARTSHQAPDPESAIEIPAEFVPLASRVNEVINSVAGETATTTAMFVDPQAGRVVPLRGSALPTNEVVATARSLVLALNRLDPEWDRYESAQGSVATGLVRCEEREGYLILTDLFIGRYPIARFRLQVSKLACLR